MADPITAEQVERAIRCAKAGVDGITVALGGFSWPDYAPGYVTELWHRVSLPTSDGEFVAALTRWHAELVAAETPRVLPPWTRVRDPETVARMVLQSALAWDPDARLIGNVTAAEVAALAGRAVMTCPACGATAWVNIDCDTCLVCSALVSGEVP